MDKDELPGTLALALAVKGGKWPHTIDAREWAKEFMARYLAGNDSFLAESNMVGWFANAIMAGYDTAQMRASTGARQRTLLEADAYCPSCGHNRDKSSVSSIDNEDGTRSCQMCGITWREL